MIFPMASLFFLSAIGTAYSLGLRDQIDLLVPISATDQVTQLSFDDSLVQIQLLDTASGQAHTESTAINRHTQERLKSQAALEGVLTVWLPRQGAADTGLVSTPGTYFTEKEAPVSQGIPIPSSRKNKLLYVSYQTSLSLYLYGLAMPLTFADSEDDIELVTRTLLITFPISFGIHLATVWGKPVTDAHLEAASLYPTSAILSSYLLPIGFGMDPGLSQMKTGSVLAMISYPATLFLSRKIGDHYASNPGRLQLRSTFTTVGGSESILTSAFLMDNRFSAQAFAWSLMGGAALGHLGADYYRQGEVIPQGVAGTILNQTLLGTLLGGWAIAVTESDDSRTVLSMIAGATGAGFAVALWNGRNSQDAYERPMYDRLGAMGGFAISGALLIGSSPSASSAITMLTVGTFAGYGITRYLTRGIVEQNDRRSEFQFRMSLDPLPYAEMTEKPDQTATLRWRIPGLVAHF